MNYENLVLISKKALRELKTFPEREREILKNRISKLEFFPLVRLDIKKIEGYQNVYRLRVGNYRRLFEYLKDQRIVRVLKIEKREKAY